MKKIAEATIAVILGCVWSCASVQRSQTQAGLGVGAPHDPCAAFLSTTQKLMLAVLTELPRVYTAAAGEIIRVQEVKTNVYDVWILHEERTDVVTFQTTISADCHAAAARVSERVEGSRTR